MLDLGNDDLIDVKQLCSMLKMTRPVVYNKLKNREIPFLRVPNSNRILFSKKQLSQWLQEIPTQSQAVQTIP